MPRPRRFRRGKRTTADRVNEYVSDDGTKVAVVSSTPTRSQWRFIGRSLPNAPPPHMPRRSTRRRASRCGTPSNAVLELLERRPGPACPNGQVGRPRRFHALSCRADEAMVGSASVVHRTNCVRCDYDPAAAGLRAHRRRPPSTPDVAVRSRSGAAHVDGWGAHVARVVATALGASAGALAVAGSAPQLLDVAPWPYIVLGLRLRVLSRSGSRSSAHNASASWSMPCEPVATYAPVPHRRAVYRWRIAVALMTVCS